MKTCRRGHIRADTEMNCRTCKTAADAARRNGKTDTNQHEPTPINAALIPDRDLRCEWVHFAAYGWTDEKIAARLGVHLKSLRKQTERRTAA